MPLWERSLPIYLTSEVRAIELRSLEADPSSALMERAGLAAAHFARDRLLREKRSVLVLAGPGNNGGDGFVLARHLKQWWFAVTVVFVGSADQLSEDARAAHDAWLGVGGEISSEIPPDHRWDLIVDALFGIGLQRDLSDRYAHAVGWVNSQPCAILALDIPSGLHADSGCVLGCSVRATHTVTFIALKPGLLTLEGPGHCGELHLEGLGIDAATLVPPKGRVIGADIVANVLPRRALNSHKGTFGNLGVLGGAIGMTGAVLLAARAGLLLGAGRVYAGALGDDALDLDPLQPELMLRPAQEVLDLDTLTCLIVGPGLSQLEAARAAVRRALRRECPLVLDADALNVMAGDDGLAKACATRSAPTVVTPHPAEAARLLGTTTAAVQDDRLAAGRALAQRYEAVVALKGTGTIVARPDRAFAVNATGNPGLASAGMGDVLSGILGALLAQGADAWTATQAAVCLHGIAADRLVEAGAGPVGLTASEVAYAARAALNRAIYGGPPEAV